MKPEHLTREQRRQRAMFDAWVTNGRFSHLRYASFVAACDRGEIQGLGPKDFENTEDESQTAGVTT